MIIPFVIGLVVGYLVPDKMLKIAIIAAIILVVVAYFGFFGLSLGVLKSIADTYGPYSSSIWGTSHGHATTWFRTNRWFCHRLHILIKWVSLETRKVLVTATR